MGKKRITRKGAVFVDQSLRARLLQRGKARKLDRGVLHIHASYNNTIVTLTDPAGNTVAQASAGSLGFKGTRKSTPYAAAKAGEVVGEQARQMGLQEVRVIVKGAGAGRESALRAFLAFGFDVVSIEDHTPIPHNGPRPPKPRRV